MSRLQKAGLAASIVQNAADLASDRQLAARRFFMSLARPAGETSFSDRSALWPHCAKTKRWKAAPRLGEDNRYILTDLLGKSEADLQALAAKGVLR